MFLNIKQYNAMLCGESQVMILNPFGEGEISHLALCQSKATLPLYTFHLFRWMPLSRWSYRIYWSRRTSLLPKKFSRSLRRRTNTDPTRWNQQKWGNWKSGLYFRRVGSSILNLQQQKWIWKWMRKWQTIWCNYPKMCRNIYSYTPSWSRE